MVFNEEYNDPCYEFAAVADDPSLSKSLYSGLHTKTIDMQSILIGFNNSFSKECLDQHMTNLIIKIFQNWYSVLVTVDL